MQKKVSTKKYEKESSGGKAKVISLKDQQATQHTSKIEKKPLIPPEFMRRVFALEMLIKQGYSAAILLYPEQELILTDMINSLPGEIEKEISAIKADLYYCDLLPAFELHEVDPAKAILRHPGKHYESFFELNKHYRSRDLRSFFEEEIGKQELYDISDFVAEEVESFKVWKHRVNSKIIELSAKLMDTKQDPGIQKSLLEKVRKWKVFYKTDKDHSDELYYYANYLNNEKEDVLGKAIENLEQIELTLNGKLTTHEYVPTGLIIRPNDEENVIKILLAAFAKEDKQQASKIFQGIEGLRIKLKTGATTFIRVLSTLKTIGVITLTKVELVEFIGNHFLQPNGVEIARGTISGNTRSVKNFTGVFKDLNEFKK